jgi:hypothetical protein
MLFIRIFRLAAVSFLVLGALVIAIEILVRFFAPYDSKELAKLHAFFLGDGKYQEPVYDSSPIFCGMLSGRVINIERAYISLFAEYVGEDSWTPRPEPRKARVGCRHELSSLPLSMTWPHMLPDPKGGFQTRNSEFDGISIGLMPQDGPRESRHWYLKKMLGDDADQIMANAEEKLPGLKSAYSESLAYPAIWYWTELDSPDVVVITCSWAKILQRIHSCRGRYLMESERIDVSITLTSEKMLEVLEIVQAVKKFVKSRLE